jgi:hypothetical protein
MQTHIQTSGEGITVSGHVLPKPRKTPPKRRKKRSSVKYVFSAITVIALIWGWWHRGDYLTAEKGIGYALGIIGGLAMLTLLTYPLRKRIKLFRGAGSIRLWFGLHMALGIIGPTLILYHANFGLGSINSNVALWSMLTVAGSGLVGRFFYSKIHRGLYGKRAEARELMAEATHFREAIRADIKTADMLLRIDDLEAEAFKSVDSVFQAATKALSISAKARRLKKQLIRNIRKNLKRAKKTQDTETYVHMRQHLSFCKRYFRRLEQAAELALYERLFAGWHVLHLPLFILLIFTAVIHVIAVHLY